MSVCGQKSNCCGTNNFCPDKFGCPPGVCPDFEIKRHDTQPPFRVSVNDCDGPLDLTDTIAEVSMWAKGKLKKTITATDTYFGLADDIGFDQANIGDVVLMDRVRNPEQMLVTGFDESLKLIQVQRGYNGTVAGSYKRGTKLRIFRILNAVAETQIITEDITELDGTVTTGVVTDSQLVYNWLPADTCLPGCYWLEFKLLKMAATSSLAFVPEIVPLTTCISGVSSVCIPPSVVPSFVPSVTGCDIGTGVEWVRRFPLDSEAFLIKVFDSPTAENLT